MSETFGPLRYTLGDKPLVKCPECGSDLTAEQSIILTLAVAGTNPEVMTRLDDDGVLEDPTGEVTKGLHSHTECAACGEMLINMEGVDELEATGNWWAHRRGGRPSPERPKSVDDIEDVLALAQAHGEDSEPDHEAGDLRDVCRMLWEWLSPEQRHLALPELREYVAETMGYEIPR